MVNPREYFVQRIRLHQAATGQHVASPRLADLGAKGGVRVVAGSVVGLDLET